MTFDMPPYLLGAKGPAQCVEIQAGKPMRIYLVPRNGAPPQVREDVASPSVHAGRLDGIPCHGKAAS